MKKILQLGFIPANTDLALLVFRLWTGFALFAKHGIEKFTNFSQMQQHFPDPLHVGSTISLSVALLADGICSLLIIIGLATRLAAFIIVINLMVVFFTMHQFSFAKEHAELVYLFLGSVLCIFIAGPGRYSIDQKLR
jgi:putative oxidoreductase